MTKTKTVKEVADTPRVFAARQTSKTFTRDGITYTIKALPNAVVNYIAGAVRDSKGNPNIGEVRGYTLAFGLVDFRGLTDKSGKNIRCELEDIEIMGKNYKWLTQDTYNLLPREHYDDLYLAVELITALSEEELEKLDFTKPLLEPEVAPTEP